MKIRRTVPPFLIVFLLTTASMPLSSSAIAPEQGVSARGEGEFLFFTRFPNELFHFSFDVQANKHGNTHGRAEFDNLTANTQVVVKVDCLRVDFNEALMTGTVLETNDPGFPKHANVVFGATDGQLFPPFRSDSITPLFVNPPFENCHDGAPPLTIFDVGDTIQIDAS
jgi:hypothetical protein